MSVAAELVGVPDLRRRDPATPVRLTPALRRPSWVWACAAFTFAGVGLAAPLQAKLDFSVVLVVMTMLTGGWLALGTPRLQAAGRVRLAIAASLTAANLTYLLDAGPWPFLAQAVFGPLGGFLFSVLIFLWPRDRLGTRAEVLWVRIGLICWPPLSLATALTYDPARDGMTSSGWWPRLGNEQVHDAVAAADGILNAVALMVFCVLVGLRFRRAARVERHELIPVAMSTAAVILPSIAFALLRPAGGDLPDWVIVTNNLLFLSVPLSLLASVAVRRVQRAMAVEKLMRPRWASDADGVRRALGQAIGDPDLELTLWSPARGAFLTTEGAAATSIPDRPGIDVAGSAGTPLARISVHPRLAGRADLIEALAGAASITLDNARLQAELRAGRREIVDAAERLAQSQDAEQLLARLLPGGVADRLREDPGALGRSERLFATVLMSDIRGYTTIAEVTDPEILAGQLNEHRRAMNAAILGTGGTVVQYVGDAVLAIFSSAELDDHQERALRAATAMQRAQAAVNASWAQRKLPAFGIGIGVTTGDVVVAFLGSDERAEYTVVGDTVNLAARLTDAARPGGTIIANATTVLTASKSWVVEELPQLTVKGRAAAITAYRVTTPTSATHPSAGSPPPSWPNSAPTRNVVA